MKEQSKGKPRAGELEAQYPGSAQGSERACTRYRAR